MSLDYVRKRTANDYSFSEKSTSTSQNDIASKSGGTYLPPGQIYENKLDTGPKADKAFGLGLIFGDANRRPIYYPVLQSRFSNEMKDHLTKMQQEQNNLTAGETFVAGTKKVVKTVPLVVMGITGSLLTIFLGVRAALRGHQDKSMKLLDVRTGLAFFTIASLVGYMMKNTQDRKLELQELKKQIMEELGEEPMEAQ